jgi:hypothetical protein
MPNEKRDLIDRIIHSVNESQRMSNEARNQGRTGWGGGPSVHRDQRVNELFRPDWEKGRAESNSGGCYLTTACVEARGLPDDCHELVTLRRFRDEYVRARPDGALLVSEYYEQAPKLVAAICVRSDGKQIFEGIYAEITQAVQHIERNELEAAFELYIATARRLEAAYGM